MKTTSKSYNFFKEGEYSTIAVYPWMGKDKPHETEHKIRWRVQSLFEGYTCLLSEERGKRPFKFKKEEEKRKDKCPIDIFKETGEERYKEEYAKPHFYERETKEWRAITNLFPFMAPLWWIVFPHHCEELSKISFNDVKTCIDYAYNLTEVIRGNNQQVEIDEAEVIIRTIKGLEEKVNGVHWGMNFGPKAGASIDHAHIQIGGIPKDTVGEADKEIATLHDKYKGEDIMSEFIDALKDKDLVVKNLNGILIYTPFAPKVSHQINIVCEDPLPNLICSTELQREKISKALFLALKGLADLKVEGEKGEMVSAGINNVNIVTKQTRFDNLKSLYRLNFEILPRETTFGFSELSGFFVCDKFPEYTTSKLKKEVDKVRL